MLDTGGGSSRDSGMSLETVNSTTQRTSMSSGSESICSTSFSRLSFELLPSSSSPESLSVKPHRSSDFAYSAIRSATFRRKSGLTFRDFHLIRRIGSGDIGTVYLCRLRDAAAHDLDDDPACFYAMKVVDKDAVALKNKSHRAEMERKILKMLDHPFLPTLYAEFEASHFSCIVMEYCSGGDLHSLRHHHHRNRFSLSSARFYAAEVLVALEYLHMLGIIYRDLKPENVLVRSDGHIMLSDFDLSLCSNAIPAVESPDYSPDDPAFTPEFSYTRPQSNTTPFACLSKRLFRSRKVQQTIRLNRIFVAEPVEARSCSFVGTHEYVSPEVASGNSHGNAVDWWSFGIFIYELVYGRTPFAGPSNEATLRNIIKKPLGFPTSTPSSSLEMHARDLVSGLLNKDPNRRLGSKRGAADVKKHPFFAGLNLALIRMVAPPEVPALRRNKTMPAKDINGKTSTSSSRQQPCTASFDYF